MNADSPGPSRPDPAHSRRSTGPVQYKGADLDAARGPGLGCFWFQVIILAILVVATPLTVTAGAPSEVSAALLLLTIVVLLFVGQTMIFLLRLVAAERRGRRRPLASSTRTVGELEDDARLADGESAAPDTRRTPDPPGTRRTPDPPGTRRTPDPPGTRRTPGAPGDAGPVPPGDHASDGAADREPGA